MTRLLALVALVAALFLTPATTVWAEEVTTDVTDISFMTVSVTDYDAALEFYIDTLGLVLMMDEPIDEATGVRWITVGVPGKDMPQIGLWRVEAVAPPSESSQTILLSTLDCKGLTEKVRAAGGTVLQEPTQQYWALEAVVTDPFGNILVLNQWADMSEEDEATDPG